MSEGDPSPLFSVLTPVYRPDPEHFREAIRSVLDQWDGDLELVVVFDGPQPPEVETVMSTIDDPRLVLVRRDDNDGIVAASNDGIAAARGEFVALLDHDDLLAPFATRACREALEEWPDADVLYSDEDKLDENGRRHDVFCKPQFSPEWLRCHMYLGHLGVYRRALIHDVGGFRTGFDGAQDHDLALRMTERARRVVHIPRILYHWRQSAVSTAADPESKRWAYDAGVRVVQSALERQGIPARAERRPGWSGIVDIVPTLEDPPLVSIVIPTAGGSRVIIGERLRLIEVCIQSVLERTTYENYEIVVVVDSNAPDELEADLATLQDARIRTVRNTNPFSFSEACNLGRNHAEGRYLVFLNDDTEVLTPDWLQRLVLFASLEGVGVVGTRLLYSDGRIQHIGLVSRAGVGHRSSGSPGEYAGPFGSYTVQANLLSVTGACICVRTDRFDAAGGFTEIFPLAFNDIDLCLKLYRMGLRTVLDSQVTLIHHESSSRDPKVSQTEFDDLFRRWRELLEDDPYDNPNLRYPEMRSVEQEQPPAYFMALKEMLGLDQQPVRPWPPSDQYTSLVSDELIAADTSGLTQVTRL